MNCRCRTIICAAEPLKERFIEPIYQAYIKKPDFKSIHCRSNKCDDCLDAYFTKSLQQSYYQTFHDHKDSLEMGKPNAIVTSPVITIDDEEMKIMQDEAIRRIREDENEIRKRYGLMQMNASVYILGGYVVDIKTGQKKTPKNDYFYDNNSQELIPIPPLPGYGRMGFGLAATDDDEIIAAGGHDFNYETMVDINILDTHADKLEWKNLPDMPSGTIGPGVSVIDNKLYIIGGFDIIGRDILCNGDALLMDLDKKQWETLPDLDPPRARTLISVDDHADPPSLIIAGGYNLDKKGKAVPHGKIEEYNAKKKKWKTITDIPNFKPTNGLSTKNNRLYLMDTIDETGEQKVIKEYNLETRQWESSNDMEQSTDRDDKKKEGSNIYYDRRD